MTYPQTLCKNAIQFTAVIFSDCGVYIQSHFQHIIDKLVAFDGFFCWSLNQNAILWTSCEFHFVLNLEVNVLCDDQP
jgi:hypothetical protein